MPKLWTARTNVLNYVFAIVSTLIVLVGTYVLWTYPVNVMIAFIVILVNIFSASLNFSAIYDARMEEQLVNTILHSLGYTSEILDAKCADISRFRGFWIGGVFFPVTNNEYKVESIDVNNKITLYVYLYPGDENPLNMIVVLDQNQKQEGSFRAYRRP